MQITKITYHVTCHFHPCTYCDIVILMLGNVTFTRLDYHQFQQATGLVAGSDFIKSLPFLGWLPKTVDIRQGCALFRIGILSPTEHLTVRRTTAHIAETPTSTEIFQKYEVKALWNLSKYLNENFNVIRVWVNMRLLHLDNSTSRLWNSLGGCTTRTSTWSTVEINYKDLHRNLFGGLPNISSGSDV